MKALWSTLKMAATAIVVGATLGMFLLLLVVDVSLVVSDFGNTPVQGSTVTGYEQITVAASVIGLSPRFFSSNAGTATQVSCRLETAEIRWTVDGTTPTTTVGTPLEALETLILTGVTAMQRFVAIRTGSTSGVLNCVYSKP